MQGVPFAELAEAHGITWPEDPGRRRSLAGRLIEIVLGKKPDSDSRPDLRGLGLEVKSIPIAWDVPKGRLSVLEDTSVTSKDTLNDLIQHAWRSSVVYLKLRSTLFVPVVKQDIDDPSLWYVRSPFVWLPSLDQDETLQSDYESIRSNVRARLAPTGPSQDRLKNLRKEGSGLFLRLGTKGQGGQWRTYRVPGLGEFKERPRAWYLRTAFTSALIQDNVAYFPVVGYS